MGSRNNPTIHLFSPANLIRLLAVFVCLHLLLSRAGNAEAGIVTHSGTISSHTTWLSTDVHRVTGTVTVSPGIVLTIEPGTVVKFNSGTGLDINGALYAVGNPSEKIVFTSYRDDSIGGDTNGDGFSTGQPGDWGRIYFSDSVTDSLTRLEYAVIRYGGSGNQGNVYINSADIPVKFSDISSGSSYGIYTYNTSPLIEGNAITGNGSHGIYNYYGSPVDRNNTITGNSNGIYAQYATPALDGNTI
ncbi:MAG: NosD domain-containing protein, partial [Nitrospira sp.]|nr:NosD domain-containing protein [Nitrospira sp.]